MVGPPARGLGCVRSIWFRLRIYEQEKHGFSTEDVAFSALGLPVLGSATTSYKTSSNSPHLQGKRKPSGVSRKMCQDFTVLHVLLGVHLAGPHLLKCFVCPYVVPNNVFPSDFLRMFSCVQLGFWPLCLLVGLPCQRQNRIPDSEHMNSPWQQLTMNLLPFWE